MYIDEALRSLSESTTACCRTGEEVLALLKQAHAFKLDLPLVTMDRTCFNQEI